MKINLLQFIVEIHKDSSFLDKILGLFSSFCDAVLKAGAAGRSGRFPLRQRKSPARKAAGLFLWHAGSGRALATIPYFSRRRRWPRPISFARRERASA